MSSVEDGRGMDGIAEMNGWIYYAGCRFILFHAWITKTFWSIPTTMPMPHGHPQIDLTAEPVRIPQALMTLITCIVLRS